MGKEDGTTMKLTTACAALLILLAPLALPAAAPPETSESYRKILMEKSARFAEVMQDAARTRELSRLEAYLEKILHKDFTFIGLDHSTTNRADYIEAQRGFVTLVKGWSRYKITIQDCKLIGRDRLEYVTAWDCVWDEVDDTTGRIVHKSETGAEKDYEVRTAQGWRWKQGVLLRQKTLIRMPKGKVPAVRE